MWTKHFPTFLVLAECTPADIFDILCSQPVGSRGETQIEEEIKVQTFNYVIEMDALNVLRLACDIVCGCLDTMMHVDKSRVL